MACGLALFFAALIAGSQAAPRPQSGDTASQQTATSTGSSSSASVPSSASNTDSSGASSGASGTSSGTADSSGSLTLIIPPQLISSFLASAGASGSSSSSSSAGNQLAGLSFISNLINTERQRFGSAVKDLVDGNVAAITDTIDTATNTGGRIVSNGVKILGAWPTFFGQLIG